MQLLVRLVKLPYDTIIVQKLFVNAMHIKSLLKNNHKKNSIVKCNMSATNNNDGGYHPQFGSLYKQIPTTDVQ
jgi:hypothetical protein